ncbi:hypothetical protein [Chelatococcus reniformis]|uniref:Uncharacterized protein n=1 Tax=Chelatococcus reniformis TaxID=1494448 RepID=A0A916XPN4_9HYPH|nr:hypothetical protein [Chelatococcus reniformis]GGC90056.1 hypothetical protein GCM10010994_54850 [Chelatococcus reniformis]
MIWLTLTDADDNIVSINMGTVTRYLRSDGHGDTRLYLLGSGDASSEPIYVKETPDEISRKLRIARATVVV